MLSDTSFVEALLAKKTEEEDEEEKPKIEIKHPGAFREWCKENNLLSKSGEVTCKCIEKALKTNDKILHKRAWFAYNFGFKRNGKVCSAVEKLKGKTSTANAEFSLYFDYFEVVNNDVKKSIDYLNNNLGYNNFLTDAIITISNKIYSGFKSIRDMFEVSTIILDDLVEYSTRTDSIKYLYKNESAIIKNVKLIQDDKERYKEFMESYVPIMPGLKVKIKDIINVLDKHKYISTLKAFIDKTNRRYENMITSKPKDLHKYLLNVDEIKFIDRNVYKIKNDLDSLVNNKVMKDAAKVKELISKPLELPELVKDVLKLGKDYRPDDLDYIMDEVEEIYEKLDLVVKNLEANIDKFNKEDLYKLSNEVKTIAEYLTATSFLYYTYLQTADMLVAIAKVLNDKSPSEIENWWKSIKRTIGLV